MTTGDAMPPLAETGDLVAAWRPLNDVEQGAAGHLLDVASAIVRQEVPQVDARIAAGQLDAKIAAYVVALMVARSMRNVEGVRDRSEGVGSLSERVAWFQEAASGSLTLTAADRRLLAGPRRRKPAGSIRLGRGLW